GQYVIHAYSLVPEENNLFSFKDVDVSELVGRIQKDLRESARPPHNPAEHLRGLVESVRQRIRKIDDDGELGGRRTVRELRDSIEGLVRAKAAMPHSSVRDAVLDILLLLKHIPDVCDVQQLARRQHHATNGIDEVWVFSDSPLEFQSSGALAPAMVR